MVTKLAGPFSDTCRFSISPRSRLRLRPARRAALTMTLITAECSMISAQGDLSIRSGQGWMISRAIADFLGAPAVGCPAVVVASRADHLVPSHLRAAASALARSCGLN